MLQMSDGTVAMPPFSIQTTPSYRLPFFLLNPLDHDDVGCPSTGRKKQHSYVAEGDGEKCSSCAHLIGKKQRADIEEYRGNFPDGLSAL